MAYVHVSDSTGVGSCVAQHTHSMPRPLRRAVSSAFIFAVAQAGYRHDSPRKYTFEEVNASAKLWNVPAQGTADDSAHLRAQQDCGQRNSSVLRANADKASFLTSGGWCLPEGEGTAVEVKLPHGQTYQLPKLHAPADSVIAPFLDRLLRGCKPLKAAEVNNTSICGGSPRHSLVDIGAGVGQYGHSLKGIDPSHRYRAYDGAGNIERVTSGFVRWTDMTRPDLALPKADWVMSLEVGEHINSTREHHFVRNLHAHNCRGIVVSWGQLGQWGRGHINNHGQRYLIETFTGLGYVYEHAATMKLRHMHNAKKRSYGVDERGLSGPYPWFATSLFVLRRAQVQTGLGCDPDASVDDHHRKLPHMAAAQMVAQTAQPVATRQHHEVHYVMHASQSLRWLAAVALPSVSQQAIETVRRLARMHGGPLFHVHANVYDQHNHSCLDGEPHVTLHTVPRYMLRFWKKVLVPELVRQYDRIFILDCDVWWTSSIFSPAEVEMFMERTGVSVMQPSIIAGTTGGRAAGSARKHGEYAADCAATTATVVERIYIARAEAYEVLWNMLMAIPDAMLDTDLMVASMWCILLSGKFPERPACMLSKYLAVVHDNTKTITKAGYDPLYFNTRIGKNTLPFIKEHWNHTLSTFTWANASFPSPMCWPLDDYTPKALLAPGGPQISRGSRPIELKPKPKHG